ncbi:MAG: PorV/PorQ family protein [Saprospiraceae bacterium]|nr:PorV/PorQ family protein [Saprospiraceae bacterium]
MKAGVLEFLGLLVLCLGAFSVAAQAPKFSNDFLNIGVGARSMGMAGAVSSNVISVQAAYWNPACMPYNPSKFQVSAQHAEWFSGIGSYDYIAFGKRFDEEQRSFGSISLIRMAIDKIPNTLRLIGPDGSIDYSRIEEFSVSDYAVLVSYARKFNDDRFSLGASAKIIHRSFGSFANAWGFGLDAAFRFRSGPLSIGLMGRDITTTYNAYRFSFSEEEKSVLQQTNNSIPVSSVEYVLPRILAGFSYWFALSEKVRLLTSADIEFSTQGTASSLWATRSFNADPRLGVEIVFVQKVFIRCGAGNFQQILVDGVSEKRELSFYPTAGVGLKLGKLTLDYALTNIGNVGVGLYSHFISMNLDL